MVQKTYGIKFYPKNQTLIYNNDSIVMKLPLKPVQLDDDVIDTYDIDVPK